MGALQKAVVLFGSLGKGLVKNPSTNLVDLSISADAGNRGRWGSDNGLFIPPAFPVAAVVDKRGATYTPILADLGAMFDVSSTSQITLPATSIGSAAAPYWLHFRKRDGAPAVLKIAAATVGGSPESVAHGTVYDEGGSLVTSDSGYVAMYQESCSLVTFGGGTWYFPPGGRQRGWIEAGCTPVGAGTASVAFGAGAGWGDPGIGEIHLSSPNMGISGTGAFLYLQPNPTAQVGTLYAGGVTATSANALAVAPQAAGVIKLTGPVNSGSTWCGFEAAVFGPNAAQATPRFTGSGMVANTATSNYGSMYVNALSTGRATSCTIGASGGTMGGAGCGIRAKVYRR